MAPGFSPVTIHKSPVTASIHQATKRSERLPCQRIPRLDFEGFLKTLHRARIHLFAEIRAPEVVMRKMARLVGARLDGALEPRNRFIKTIKFNQICADVVVRIAEFWIDFDRALALGDGFFDAALKMIRPAEKR